MKKFMGIRVAHCFANGSLAKIKRPNGAFGSHNRWVIMRLATEKRTTYFTSVYVYLFLCIFVGKTAQSADKIRN